MIIFQTPQKIKNLLVIGVFFNKREFEEELGQIDWDDIINPQVNTNTSFSIFYNRIVKLLDEMAPYKKITKKEAGIQQRPWITKGLLISMNKRDSLYKEFANEINPDNKEKLGSLYKK